MLAVLLRSCHDHHEDAVVDSKDEDARYEERTEGREDEKLVVEERALVGYTWIIEHVGFVHTARRD